MSKKNFLIALFVIFPLAVGLACLSSKPDPTATPVPTDLPAATEPATRMATPFKVTPEESKPNTPVSPTGFQELVLLDKSYWIQDGNTVFVSFFLDNANSDLMFEDVEFTIYLYDANGNEIDSTFSSLPWIFPNQTVGIVESAYISEDNLTVDDVQVDWVYGDTSIPEDFTDPFVVENLKFWDDDYIPTVTGEIRNLDVDTYLYLNANVICYDSAGEIVGGGSAYIDFVPGEDTAGFSSYVDIYGEVASLEVFPVFTYASEFVEGTDFWSDFQVLDHYFYEGGYGSMFGGALIKNSTNTILRDSILFVTFYDEQGYVTATGAVYPGYVFPGDTLGITPWVSSLSENAESETYDIMVFPGEAISNYELQSNPFVINNATLTGDYDDNVLVSFTNTYTKSVSDVEVYVLLKNASGQIIGGGSDWTTEPTPAGGTTDIEIWVQYDDSETIDTIEVWATPNSWTEFN